MIKGNSYLTIGQTAKRSGVAASTLRFYETRHLIQSHRGAGNQRRYHRSMLRRIAVIKVAQSLGLTLREIEIALSSLPENRTPNKKDWEKLSKKWRVQLDEQISSLVKLRERLSGCIGCGCLSLRHCALYNPNDQIAEAGPGPQLLFNDRSREV